MNEEIQEVLHRSMTVRELRAALAAFGDDVPVVVKIGYGDRCNTQQALPVRAADRLGPDEYFKETGYSESGVAIEELDGEEEPEEKECKLTSRCEVVVIDL